MSSELIPNPDQAHERLEVVIPAYNRHAVLRRCVAACRDSGWPEGTRIVVVDDASPDRSGDRIRIEFPDVEVITGTGNLWWAGCINLGMEQALQRGADYVLWLNEDCFLNPGTAAALWENRLPNGIVTARAVTPSGQTYGGWLKGRRSFHPAPLVGSTVRCDATSGNCVIVGKRVHEIIGGLHHRLFPQAYGDLDFGLRARSAGLAVIQVNAPPCENLNHETPINLRPLEADGLPGLLARWTDPRSHLNLGVCFRFYARHRPWTWPAHLLAPYLFAVMRNPANYFVRNQPSHQVDDLPRS